MTAEVRFSLPQIAIDRLDTTASSFPCLGACRR